MPFIPPVTSPAIKYLVIALAAIVLLVGAYIKGRSDGEALTEAAVAAERHKWELKVAQTQAEADKRIAEAAAKYQAKADEYRAEIEKLRKRKPDTKVVEKVVEVYVPQRVDTPVPRGLVDLHNTAAEGRPLADAPKSDADQPSTISLSDVGAVVARNYYQCNITRAQLEALQAVVAEYQKKQKELTK